MADEGNIISNLSLDGAEGVAPNGEDNSPAIGLISQYIKDLSVENPNAPESYQWTEAPEIHVDFNIAARALAPDVHEIELKINVTSKGAQGTAFIVELAYGALIGMRNVTEEQAHPFLFAEGRAWCSRSPAASWPMPCATPAIRRCCSIRSTSTASTWRSWRRPKPRQPPNRPVTPDHVDRRRSHRSPRAVHEPPESDRHDRRADPGQPRARPGARQPVCPLCRRRLCVGRLPDRVPPAQHVPGAVCRRAFSSAFIPMFNKKVGDPEGRGLPDGLRFAEEALAVLLPALIVMTVALEVLAWPVTLLLSGGFNGVSPEQFAFAVSLSRLTIPYLMLISLVSLFGGILNSLHKFWVNAAAPSC
jgi:protein-export chaperone SecB